MTNTFNPRIRNSLIKVADKVLKAVEKPGVLLYARHNVQICIRMQSGAKQQYGFQGKQDDKAITMSPQPAVDLRTQYRVKDGTVIAIGDARLYNIPQTYTRDMLTSASFFLIDGVEYNHVGGTLKDQVSGIFWEMILKKRENSAK